MELLGKSSSNDTCNIVMILTESKNSSVNFFKPYLQSLPNN